MTGLSADGRVATGWSDQRRFGNPGFTWTAIGGRADFGLNAGMPAVTFTAGVSSDGGTIAGTTRLPSSITNRAYIYSGGIVRNLGTIEGYAFSEASGISGDGTVVVGDARDANFFGSEAFRWTDSGGMQGLGFTRPSHFYSTSMGISRDGRSIVGYSYDGTTTDAFVWTQDHGMQGLRGIDGLNAHAYGVNATGTVVVGESYVDSHGGNRAVAWVNGSLVNLGPPPEAGPSFARAVSDDGSVIVGNCVLLSNDQNRAMIWTAAGGSVLLSDYVTGLGVSVPAGWQFFYATSVSADGRTIGGFGGFDGDLHHQGFVVTIPSPPSVLVLYGAILTARRRRV
ncbi:MAG: hypothetical protein AABZ53_14715 [Planctomycetota bacterium]